jgi:hypothetical protein
MFVALSKIMFTEWAETGPSILWLTRLKILQIHSGFTNKTYLAGLHAIAQIGVWEPPGLLMCPFSSPAYKKQSSWQLFNLTH